MPHKFRVGLLALILIKFIIIIYYQSKITGIGNQQPVTWMKEKGEFDLFEKIHSLSS